MIIGDIISPRGLFACQPVISQYSGGFCNTHFGVCVEDKKCQILVLLIYLKINHCFP